jgi:hypothetical protein
VTIPNRFSKLWRSKGIGRSRFDAPVLVAGGLLSGALALGAALALRSWADAGSDVGPTAATLNEAFSLLYGAAIGLAVGAAFVAFAARRGPRVLSGLFAGLFGYAIVLAPALIVTAPSDVSTGESIVTAVLGAILLVPALLFGAAVSAGVAGRRTTGLYRRAR